VSVLVFSKTTGFRHESIPAGVEALGELGAAHGFAVEATEDAAAFDSAHLAGFRAVVFLNTSSDILDPGQRSAFEAYIRGGGGFVGVHGAADTEYSWPFYGGLVGAYFESHPAVQAAIVTARGGQASWHRVDEWYNFRRNPRADVQVLVTVDEASYQGGTMGADHPLAWCQPYQGGRSFYTGMGNTVESYSEPAFREHLLGGIRYAAAF
jgi:type 1 glutamine amidotransferase